MSLASGPVPVSAVPSVSKVSSGRSLQRLYAFFFAVCIFLYAATYKSFIPVHYARVIRTTWQTTLIS